MQRCLSGLRSTIGNRVLRERNRRFKSSSLRQRKKICNRHIFFVLFFDFRRGFEGGSRFAGAKRFARRCILGAWKYFKRLNLVRFSLVRFIFN